jgi:hypothetical protein
MTPAPEWNPVPTLEGIFPRPHPSAETLAKLGTAALLLGPLAGTPAILLGRLVLREIGRSAGRYTGEEKARLGLRLAWIGTQVHTLLALYVMGASSEPIALAVLITGVVLSLTITVGVSFAGAPRAFAAAADVSRRAPWIAYPAVIGLLGAGSASFIVKRKADERVRIEALAACEESRREAKDALGVENFERALSHLQAARRTCVGATLEEVARAETDVNARELEAIRRRAEEEAAREKVRRAEEERQRAEAERKAVAAFQKAAPEIARDLQIASSRAAQKRWEDAESALSKAEQALSAFRGTNIQQSERCAELLAQLERLRPDVNAGVQQLEEKREEQERKRQEMKEAAEERRQASLRVQCCDGTLSPSCLCDRPSKRGCCSHHGGVCGCED